jgi:hypothetical protein
MKIRFLQMTKRLCFLMVFSLMACSKPPIKTLQVMDFSNPGEIELHISEYDDIKPQDSISQTVMANLKHWDYPVVVNPSPKVSHVLTATVGAVVQGSSPPGFSYSAGNSDPRSLEFQKMAVLPIHCQLKSTTHPAQVSELSMDFMADKNDKAYLATDKLADHISTVCFNLLTDVKWPLKEKQAEQGSAIKSHSWIPEIRIEDKVTNEDPITAPVVPPSTSSTTSSEKNVKTPALGEDAKPEEPKVRIQRDEPRRQIIIHNQGSPVILEFGYERR